MHTEKIRLTIYGDCSQGKENIFQVFLLEINLSSLNESQLKSIKYKYVTALTILRYCTVYYSMFDLDVASEMIKFQWRNLI